MTKRRTAKKLSLKRVKIRSFEGREIGGQPSKETPEWKVIKKLLGKQHQKKKTMRNKEKTSHQSSWHNVSSSTQGSEGRELVVPWNLRVML